MCSSRTQLPRLTLHNLPFLYERLQNLLPAVSSRVAQNPCSRVWPSVMDDWNPAASDCLWSTPSAFGVSCHAIKAMLPLYTNASRKTAMARPSVRLLIDSCGLSGLPRRTTCEAESSGRSQTSFILTAAAGLSAYGGHGRPPHC